MRYVNVTALHASDAMSQTSAQIDTNQLISASFMAYFGDATAAGTLTLQASNDPIQSGLPVEPLATNWVNIPNATATVTAGGSVIIPLYQSAYRWIRIVYTSGTPGTSTITVNYFGFSQ